MLYKQMKRKETKKERQTDKNSSHVDFISDGVNVYLTALVTGLTWIFPILPFNWGIFSSPGGSPGRAIVLPPALAAALAKC